MALQVRRVVTGHDQTGRAIIKIDDSALGLAIAGAVVAVGLALVPAAEVSTHGA